MPMASAFAVRPPVPAVALGAFVMLRASALARRAPPAPVAGLEPLPTDWPEAVPLGRAADDAVRGCVPAVRLCAFAFARVICAIWPLRSAETLPPRLGDG